MPICKWLTEAEFSSQLYFDCPTQHTVQDKNSLQLSAKLSHYQAFIKHVKKIAFCTLYCVMYD